LVSGFTKEQKLALLAELMGWAGVAHIIKEVAETHSVQKYELPAMTAV
jgi:hypothetical protein